MEPQGNKLEKWQNKSEREKHTLAVFGASVCTVLITLVWAYNFVTVIEEKKVPKSVASEDRYSPLSAFKDLFIENIDRVKNGLGTVSDSASAIFSGGEYVREEQP